MMKKITMWMLILAMAVSPMLAQQADSTNTEEEQPIEEMADEQVSEEPALEEAASEEAALEEAAAEEAALKGSALEESGLDEPGLNESVSEGSVSEGSAGLSEEEQVDQAIEEATGGVWVDEALEEEVAPALELAPVEEEPAETYLPAEASLPAETYLPAEEIQEPLMEEIEEDDHRRPQHREVQTLMSGGGGYGAISVGYTQVNGLNALQMGAQAEWLVGHGFGLGIAGVGFTSDFAPMDADYYALSGGYGGLIMEPIIFGWLPVHIALPVLIGGGGMASYSTNADPWDYDNIDPTFGEYAVFFVGEVGVELEFNLVKFFRLSLFGNYRWTTSLDMKPMYGLDEVSPYVVGPHALNGWSTGVRFKFGSF